MSNEPSECPGVVSMWVGTFPSLEAAEAYFGIPDEIGVYLPPEGFAADLGLSDVPPERLEVNFSQLSLRPINQLLADATFAASFIVPAVEAAVRLGIEEAQGVALLYDFDYTAQLGYHEAAGPLRFIGRFPFAREGPLPDAVRDSRITVRDIQDDVL